MQAYMQLYFPQWRKQKGRSLRWGGRCGGTTTHRLISASPNKRPTLRNILLAPS